MLKSHVIIDGSNIATEGRTKPSLAQLDDAVRAFQTEFPEPEITVVVDASFVRRIDEEERAPFEAGVEAGEIVVPPAGAVGRGDAFVLSIAERVDASIFSNDSFQEFHGEYEWLFQEDRLVGGKPVPGIGWVFVMRTPVRGPTSRRAQREARSAKKEAKKEAQQAEQQTPKKKKKQQQGSSKGEGGKGRDDVAPRDDTSELQSPDQSKSGDSAKRKGRSSRSGGGKEPEPVNDPMAFIAFVSEHPIGSTVEATVDRFSSHGAYATVGETDCYVPLKAMGDPAPRSAKELLTVGESRPFVVDAFDSPRRSVDLALPGMETAAPTDQVAEDISAPDTNGETTMATKKRSAKKGAAKKKSTAKKSPAKKKSTAKKSTAKKGAAKKSPAKKKSTAKKSTAKKGAAKKSPAKKSTAKKGAAKKSPAKKKSTAKKGAAKKR